MDQSKTELFSTLFSHCEQKQTGTLFITNNDNRSCQIVIQEGEVISMAFGMLKGDEVLSAIKLMVVTRYSFKKDLLLPMPAEAQIASSMETLQKLGYRQTEETLPTQNTEPVSEEKSQKPVVMYRGQVVKSSEPEKKKKPAPTAPSTDVKSKKPLRMYRGQVVSG